MKSAKFLATSMMSLVLVATFTGRAKAEMIPFITGIPGSGELTWTAIVVVDDGRRFQFKVASCLGALLGCPARPIESKTKRLKHCCH